MYIKNSYKAHKYLSSFTAQSGQVVSNVYEFAEKEPKNKGDSFYNYKNYLPNQQVKVLKEAGAHHNLQNYQMQGLATAVIVKPWVEVV